MMRNKEGRSVSNKGIVSAVSARTESVPWVWHLKEQGAWKQDYSRNGRVRKEWESMI